MRPITIRNLFRKSKPWFVGLVGGLLLSAGLLYAQPGQSPNFAWLRGAALGSDPAMVCQGLDTNVNCNIVTQGTGTLLLNGAPVTGGSSTFTSITVNGTSALNGLITARPGASVIGDLLGGIVLSNSGVLATTSVAGVETDLFNFSVPANTLSANNQYLHLQAKVRNAATGNNKQTRIYFGATTIGDSTAVGANNNWWIVDCYVWRTGAATQKAVCNTLNATNGGSWATGAGGGVNLSSPAETLSGAVVMRLTGTDAVAAAGTNLEGYNLLWFPQGQ